MKIEMYEKKEPCDPVVRIAWECAEEGVRFFAVDMNGEPLSFGYLFEVLHSGRIHRFTGVNASLGFDLDEDERIKLEDEE